MPSEIERQRESTPILAPRKNRGLVMGAAGGAAQLGLVGASWWQNRRDEPQIKKQHLESARQAFEHMAGMDIAPAGVRLIGYTHIKDGCLVVEVAKPWFRVSRDDRTKMALELRDGWLKAAGVDSSCFEMVDADGRRLLSFDSSSPNVRFGNAF